MNKNLFLFIFLLISTTALFAQQPENDQEPGKKGFDRSRLFAGGNFGLSFGNYTFINISPQVGYRFTNMFAAGIGINGQFTQLTDRYGSQTVSRSKYGVTGMNIFGRFYPIQQAFIQAQPEMNYIWGSVKDYSSNTKYSLNGKILPSFLLGAGGILPMGNVGGLLVMVQYDVLNKTGYGSDPSTPYGNKPFVSIGFNFGLGR